MARIRVAAAALALLITATPSAQAQLLDTGLGSETTFRAAGSGPGQGVAVTTGTNLTGMGFYLGTQGANVKFMIWDGANSALLFSQSVAVSARADGTLTTSDPFAFFLNAGQTYHFGLIADNNINVNFFFPPIGHSENGLTLVGNNTNYSDYANPTPAPPGGASIALVLYGSQGQVVPEPISIILLGTGLAGVAAVRRRRRAIA